MFAEPVPSTELPKGSIERACARLANRAKLDTIRGGARAMVMADRAERMRLPNADELQNVVADVYSRSTGRHSETYGAWTCGECGSVHAGRQAAEECCYAELEEPEEVPDNWPDDWGDDWDA